MIRLCAVALSIALLAGGAGAQPKPVAPHGPQYIGVFEAAIQDDVRVPLERQTLRAVTEIKFMGYGGAESSVGATGERSPVRFKAGEPLSFVVRVQDQHTDPSMIYHLSALKPKKGSRFQSQVKTGSMGLSARSTGQDSQLPFDAVSYGAEFVRLTPRTPLPPGEYMIGLGGLDEFLFGVD